jgi:bacterial/archaeal transporter family protein
MQEHRWLVYALLSAGCAALVAVFGRVGVKSVDPNVGTMLRSVVMTAFLVVFVTAKHGWGKLPKLASLPALMLLLAGLAGATSWLFYFNALRIADVSRVAPIDKLSTVMAVVIAVLFLGERPTVINWAGVVLMVAGAYLVAFKPAA